MSFTYDNLGRLVTITFLATGQVTTFVYDACGNRTATSST